jgi:hypothetical protein
MPTTGAMPRRRVVGSSAFGSIQVADDLRCGPFHGPYGIGDIAETGVRIRATPTRI